MNIFEIIGKIFKKKVKLLPTTIALEKEKVVLQNENKLSQNDTKFDNDYTTKIITKEKLAQFFSYLGCAQETINKIVDKKELDIDNIKKNIDLLASLGYTKLQLATIIGTNTEILCMNNNQMKRHIDAMKKCYDIEIVKNIIYRNSMILDGNNYLKVSQIKSVLDDFNILVDDQKDILDENINILSINPKQIRESLNLIKDFLINKDEFLSTIIVNPQIIGIKDLSVIKKILDE